MHTLFEIQTSKDRLSATVTLKSDVPEGIEISSEKLTTLLTDRKIVFGLKQDHLKVIADNPLSVEYPVIVAEGISPQNGRDGYIINKTEIDENQGVEDNKDRSYNLRNVMKIKSVKSGQLLATIVPPTIGIPGKSIYGTPIPAKNGKPVKLKPGKNVMFHLEHVFSTVDGQVSITPNTVNVFPVFEVNGDLDLKTGNIDFIGNVIIRGNVPTGYEVIAGGDIKVTGLVEGAKLIAGGSIAISGGIAGGSRGYVEAGVDIHSNYLNQATCKAGNEVVVDSSILHSSIDCGGRVLCRKGHIIGGKISALKSIEAVDFGNHHYMQTVLYIGDFQKDVEEEIHIHKEIKEINDSLSKLNTLAERLNQRHILNGTISAQEKHMLEKQKITVLALKKKLMPLEERLKEIKDEHAHNEDSYLKANGVIFPNTQIHFGKYCKPIPSKLQGVKIHMSQGEIVSVPL